MKLSKNKFVHLDEGITVLIIPYKKKIYLSLLDTEDFEKVNQFKWFLNPQNDSDQIFRVRTNRYLGNKKTTSIYLHHLIIDTPVGMEIDHINHNPLDNRKNNLRIVTRRQNQQNKKSARKDNKSSGIRNVYFDKSLGKYKVCIRLNGKNKHIGVFDDIYEAEKVAIETRRKYMPFSQEGTEHEIIRSYLSI